MTAAAVSFIYGCIANSNSSAVGGESGMEKVTCVTK